MKSHCRIVWFAAALLALLLLAACSGGEEATSTFPPAPTEKPAEPTQAPTVEPSTAPVVEPTKEAIAETCEPATDGPLAGINPQGVTIDWWHQHSREREEQLLVMVDDFNATNPYSIIVEGEYAGGYSEIYDRVIQGLHGSGPLPNAVAGYPNQLAEYARYGAVRFLDDYLDDPEVGIPDTTDFFPGVLEYYRLAQYGHQLAGLQPGRSIEVMYYNADLLAAAGLSVPTT